MFFDKAHSRFFADPLNTWNVIGRIAHKRLYVNKFSRCDVVLFLNSLVIINNRFIISRLCNRQNDLCFVTRKLQIIFIARCNETAYFTFFTKSCNCSDYVISLVTLFFKNCYAHCTKYILCKRHLCGKSLGHWLTLCLVSLVLLMTKCRCFHVKSRTNIIRLLLLYQFQ